MKGMRSLGQVSPKCPHFLKTRGMGRSLHGSKGLEKTKVREQVVDKVRKSIGAYSLRGRDVGTSSAPEIVPNLFPFFGFHGGKGGLIGFISD
jgi:hypothetical protein